MDENKKIKITPHWFVKLFVFLRLLPKSTGLVAWPLPQRKDQPIFVSLVDAETLNSNHVVFLHGVHLSIKEARKTGERLILLADQMETWGAKT